MFAQIRHPVKQLEEWLAAHKRSGLSGMLLGGKRGIAVLFSTLIDVAVTRLWLISNGVDVTAYTDSGVTAST
jgi:hypothetical protein